MSRICSFIIPSFASTESLLDSILSRDACRVGPPTIEQLTAHRFFAEYAPQYDKLHAALCADQKPTLKLSTTAKEQVRLAQQRCEQRLQNEQKATKNQKRLVKLQEMMSSEEEKKQKVARGQQKQQRAAAAAAAAASASADQTRQSRLRQQNSLQLSGGPPGAATSSAATGAGTSTIGRSESAHGGLVSPPSKSASRESATFSIVVVNNSISPDLRLTHSDVAASSAAAAEGAAATAAAHDVVHGA